MNKSGPFDRLKNSVNSNILSKVSLNPSGLIHIGRTIVSDKFPITMDTFWATINSNVIINPFDFVTAENLHNTRTIGIVKELQSIAIYEETMVESINDNPWNVVKSPEPQGGQKSLTKSAPTSKAVQEIHIVNAPIILNFHQPLLQKSQ